MRQRVQDANRSTSAMGAIVLIILVLAGATYLGIDIPGLSGVQQQAFSVVSQGMDLVQDLLTNGTQAIERIVDAVIDAVRSVIDAVFNLIDRVLSAVNTAIADMEQQLAEAGEEGTAPTQPSEGD